MVGTAGLPHVIVRFYTVPNVRAARYSAGWALLFIALLYTTAPALATFARYNLIQSLNGATVKGVEEVDGKDIYQLTKTRKDGSELDLFLQCKELVQLGIGCLLVASFIGGRIVCDQTTRC